MMGKQHAAMGAAGWIALAAPQPIGVGVIEASAVTLILGTIMARGTATIPDMDHTSASPTQALPPFTRWGISRLIGKAFGGHRNGTHAVIGIALVTLVAWLAGVFGSIDTPSLSKYGIESFQLGAFIVAGFVSLLALQVSGIKGIKGWVYAAIIGLLIVLGAPDNIWWLPLVVGVGAFIHSLGDFMTVAGINWIWPFVIKPRGGKDRWYGPIVHYKNGRWAMPFFGKTGESATPKHQRRMKIFMWIINGYVYIVLSLTVAVLIPLALSGHNFLTTPLEDGISEAASTLFSNVRLFLSGVFQ